MIYHKSHHYQNGFLSAIPWLFFLAAASASGPLADYIRRDGVFSNTFVRRLMTCGGFGIEGGAFLILFFLSNRDAALVLLSIGIGFGGKFVPPSFLSDFMSPFLSV